MLVADVQQLVGRGEEVGLDLRVDGDPLEAAEDGLDEVGGDAGEVLFVASDLLGDSIKEEKKSGKWELSELT